MANIITDFGAVGDGVTDDTQAFLAAAAAGVKTLFIPATDANRYIVNESVTFTNSIAIMAESPETIIDATGGTYLESHAIGCIGSITQIVDLVANATIGGNQLVFNTGHGIEPFDVLAIFNPTDGSWFNHPNRNYRAGEFCKVHSVIGNTVKIFGKLYDDYVATDVEVYKLTPHVVSIVNLNVESNIANSQASIRVKYGTDVRLDNVRGAGSKYCGMELWNCYNIRATALRMENNSPIVNDEYGLCLASCQNAMIQGSFYATRHGTAIGAYEDVLAFPNRNIRIHDSIIENDKAANIGAADMHGCVEDIHYDNCSINTAAVLAGYNISYRGCSIGNGLNGNVMYGSEVYGGNYFIENCELETDINPHLSAMGIVHLVPQSSQVEDLRLIMRNNSIKAGVMTTGSPLIRVSPINCVKKLNVIIDGIDCNVNTALSVLIGSPSAGSYYANFLMVRNISCNFAIVPIYSNAATSGITKYV